MNASELSKSYWTGKEVFTRNRNSNTPYKLRKAYLATLAALEVL
jgi:hypothetical protein